MVRRRRGHAVIWWQSNSPRWSPRTRHPKTGSWTGCSVRLWGCRARRNDAEWSFHSKELQRSHARPQPCNTPRSALTQRVKLDSA